MRTAAILAVLVSGCSAIPTGGDPAADPAVVALAARHGPPLGRLGVARIATTTLAESEAAKGWRLLELPAASPEELTREVARALDASGSWDRVRLAAGDAWRERDDYVLSVSIHDVRTSFDGHNGWWIPNIVNFVTNTPAAWWIATEQYTLSLVATLAVESVDSGRRVLTVETCVRTSGTFDDFDRGWQFFGPIQPSFDADTWRNVASALLPAASTALAVRVAEEADAGLRRAPRADLAAARRKTVTLTVGITHYDDPRAFPPLPFASGDARSFAGAIGALGEPASHQLALTDERATLAAVVSAVADHLGRARAGDSAILYFAGYGGRAPTGERLLAFADGGTVPVCDLCERVARLEGEKLIIIDAGFGAGGRSIQAGGTGGADADEPEGLALMLAAAGRETVLAPEHLGAGLFTHELIRELVRAGEPEREGGAGLEEVFANVRGSVVAEAELLGERQTPALVGRAKGFTFEVKRQASPSR